jgi:hypothetical protein
MVFNATFNNISVSSLRSVLLVQETGVHGENQPPHTKEKKKHVGQTITYPIFFHLEINVINIKIRVTFC